MVRAEPTEQEARAKSAGQVARAELTGLKTPTVEQKTIIAEQMGPKISTVEQMTTTADWMGHKIPRAEQKTTTGEQKGLRTSKADNHHGGSGKIKDHHNGAGSRPPLQEALQIVGGPQRPPNSGSLDLDAPRTPESGPWALKVKPRGLRTLRLWSLRALIPVD